MLNSACIELLSSPMGPYLLSRVPLWLMSPHLERLHGPWGIMLKSLLPKGHLFCHLLRARYTVAGFPKLGGTSPGVPQNNLIIFGIHQHHFSKFNHLDPLCSVKHLICTGLDWVIFPSTPTLFTKNSRSTSSQRAIFDEASWCSWKNNSVKSSTNQVFYWV